MLNSPYNKPKIAPPAEHPRLMLRRKDIPRIKENLSHPENKRAYELWRYLCECDVYQFENDIQTGYYNSRLIYLIEARAFEALIYDDKKKAREVVELALRVMRNYDSSLLPLSGGRLTGHYIFTMSQVYDWLYDSLSADEREELIAIIEKSANDLEMNYPPYANKPREVNAVYGHDNEAQLLRDLMSFSIAVYDERPDIYDYCAGFFFDKYLPTYNITNDCRMHFDGTDYGSYRTAFIYWVGLIFLSMTGERIFTENTENIAEWLLYTIRPDGQSLRIGNAFIEDKGGYTMEHPYTVPMFLAGALTGNENYRKYYFDNYVDEYMLPTRYRGRDYYRDGGFGEGMYTPTVHLVWNRITEPKEVPALPMAKYYSFPAGATFYNNKDKNTLVFMYGDECGGVGHDHMEPGSFQIYHRGILASDSGSYHLFGSEPFYMYSIRTIAHNCILIESGDEKIYTRYGMKMTRDGGCKVIDATARRAEDIFEKHRMSYVLEHREGDDGCYMKVDTLPAYDDVCDKMIREMTYDATKGEYGTFTVHDEIETKKASFTKKFLLHCQQEPKLEGNTITIENKGGRLVCRVIEPANAKIELIGGEGKEFMVNGVNYPDDNLDGKEYGWGRIEISPPEANIRDVFHVEMEILDRQ